MIPPCAKPYRVGVLNEAFGPNPPVVLGLKAGLVELGLQEGRDVTGISGLTTPLAPKRLEMLKACAPALRRAWAVYARDDLSSAASARRYSRRRRHSVWRYSTAR